VKDALTVAGSPTAVKAATEYRQLTLDRLVAIADFDGDEEAAQMIAECGDEDLPYVVQHIRDERATEEAQTRLVEQFQQDGHTVHTDYPDGAENLTALTDTDYTAGVRPALIETEHAHPAPATPSTCASTGQEKRTTPFGRSAPAPTCTTPATSTAPAGPPRRKVSPVPANPTRTGSSGRKPRRKRNGPNGPG
jgi:hypothetical protein